jgi:hypothetical protein
LFHIGRILEFPKAFYSILRELNRYNNVISWSQKLILTFIMISAIACAPSAIDYVGKGAAGSGGFAQQGPGAFSFTNQTGVALGATITSNAVPLSGFTGILPAVCVGCVAILRNGSATNGSLFVSGDTISIQLLSPLAPNTSSSATVTVGSTTSKVWSVSTTLNTPGAFNFTNQTGVITNAPITSDTVVLGGTFSGLTATCNAGCIAISRNGGAFTAGPVAGFNNGDTITIRLTSASSSLTAATATVSVGGTTSSSWSVTTTNDPCAAAPSVGTICADGTIYAGLTPDGNVPMFAAPCDDYISGVNCATGSFTGLRFALGQSINSGINSSSLGKANTAALFALNGNADSPYEAATYCKTLTQNGHSDWYLPAEGELNLLYVNKVAIGHFIVSGYWSSTEFDAGSSRYIDFSNGSQNITGKTNGSLVVRCVRR